MLVPGPYTHVAGPHDDQAQGCARCGIPFPVMRAMEGAFLTANGGRWRVVERPRSDWPMCPIDPATAHPLTLVHGLLNRP